jgi:hypothetical protein
MLKVNNKDLHSTPQNKRLFRSGGQIIVQMMTLMAQPIINGVQNLIKNILKKKQETFLHIF